jgi:hypothetical protein
MKCITLFLCSTFVFILFTGHSLDFYWTNADNANSKWNNPGNWDCPSDPTATYPNNINNHNAYFPADLGNCVVPSLIQVKELKIDLAYTGVLTINNVFIVRDLLEVKSPSAKIIAPSSDYIGIRGSIELENGGNFEHNSGKIVFYGGMHNISVEAGTLNPWVLHDVQVTKGAASGAYVKFILNTGEVEIHGTTTLGGHPSTGIFFHSGLFLVHGDCIIDNVTSSVTYQDGGLCFVGNADQTIENIGAPNPTVPALSPALFSGLIGRIVIDKPALTTMYIKGAISVMREFKIAPTNEATVDALDATLILTCVSGAPYPDPTYNCRVNLDTPLTVDNLVINPRQNAGFEIIGVLTVINSLETRGNRRLNFQEGLIDLKGDLFHNNYFGYSTSGDPMGSGVIRFSGSSQQKMDRTPSNLREFKGMLPSIEIDNSNGVEINGMFVVDGNINFLDGHFTYPTIDPTVTILGLKQLGTVTNANDNSYVKGPFRHYGEVSLYTSFDYPVGEEGGNDKYRPIRISNLDLPNSNNPKAYTALTARYFLEDPNLLSNNLSPLIGSITDCEYWKLDEYYSPWAGITPYSFTCNVGLSWYSNLNDNCDNNFYEFASHVASLRSTGDPLADVWIDEGNNGIISLPANYDMIISDANVSTMSDAHDNYYTLGSDLIPCGTGPDKYYVCHNGNNLCLNINALQAHLDHGDYLGPCNPTMMKNAQTQKGVDIPIVYPNPFDERFTMELNYNEPVSIIIQDLLGAVLHDYRNIRSSELIVDMTGLTPGFYTYSIHNENGLLHSGKIIKN